MLTSSEAWALILENAPRGEWCHVRALYELVGAHAQLDATDLEPVGGASSARWHRTVRNALQSARKRNEVRYERGRGFLLENVPAQAPRVKPARVH
jgi:hypothetical protein